MSSSYEDEFKRMFPHPEGVSIRDPRAESIRVEYGTDDKNKQFYELDLLETLPSNQGILVPVYEINEDESRGKLRRVVAFDEDAKIIPGETITPLASMSPRKRYLTEKSWVENKGDIRLRRAAVGGAALGGTVFLGAGIVLGTVWTTRTIKKRK